MTISPNPTEPWREDLQTWWEEQEGFGLRGERAFEEIGPRARKWLEAACEVGWTSRDRAAQETADRLVEAEKALKNISQTVPLTRDDACKIVSVYFSRPSHPQNQGKETP